MCTDERLLLNAVSLVPLRSVRMTDTLTPIDVYIELVEGRPLWSGAVL